MNERKKASKQTPGKAWKNEALTKWKKNWKAISTKKREKQRKQSIHYKRRVWWYWRHIISPHTHTLLFGGRGRLGNALKTGNWIQCTRNRYWPVARIQTNWMIFGVYSLLHAIHVPTAEQMFEFDGNCKPFTAVRLLTKCNETEKSSSQNECNITSTSATSSASASKQLHSSPFHNFKRCTFIWVWELFAQANVLADDTLFPAMPCFRSFLYFEFAQSL